MSENPYAAPSTDSFSLDSGNTPSTSTLSWIILILLILFLVAGFFLVSRG
jgi:hypothetical protein